MTSATKRKMRLRPSQGGSMGTRTPLFAPELSVAANAGAFATDADRNARGRIDRCDCANPACELWVGRCFLCKGPVENDRTYAVCCACDDKFRIRQAWRDAYDRAAPAARAHGVTAERECFCPGWL